MAKKTPIITPRALAISGLLFTLTSCSMGVALAGNPATNTLQNTTTSTANLVNITLPSSLPTPSWGSSLNGALGYLVTFFLGIIAVAGFFGIIYGAYMMITSGGDSSKFASGRKSITWATVGIIVAVLSYVIIELASKIANSLF
jgi:hypothetical protein